MHNTTTQFYHPHTLPQKKSKSKEKKKGQRKERKKGNKKEKKIEEKEKKLKRQKGENGIKHPTPQPTSIQLYHSPIHSFPGRLLRSSGSR